MKCRFNDCCNKRALYNFPGKKPLKPLYCSDHKLNNMIIIYYTTCANEECYKKPSFNLPGEHAKYCGNHKSPNMVFVLNYRSVTFVCVFNVGICLWSEASR